MNADTTADGAAINIDSIGDLPVGLVDAAGGDVILNSTIAINDATADTTVDVIANALTLTAQGEIGGTRALETTVGSLDASAQAAGDIVIAETSGITLTDVDTVDGSITISAGGAIVASDVAADGDGDEDDVILTATSGGVTVGTVSADVLGDVTIVSADAVTDTVAITADTLTVKTKKNGGAAITLNTGTTDVETIDLQARDAADSADAAGAITFVDADGVDIATIRTTSTASVTAGGAINDASVDTAVDVIANSLTLTAQGEIGGTRALETTVGSLDASSTTAGDIVITETDGITLTDVDTANGAITINTGGSAIVTDVAASGSGDEDDVAITAASGDVTIDVVSAAGSGDVTIEASAGSINETDAGDSAVDITADVLTLTAQDEIGGAGELDIETTVATLEAHSTTAGDIVIVETDDVDLQDIKATLGSVYLEATGGGMTYGAGTITAGASTLTMVQQDSLDLKDFTFANQNGTDFMAEITGSGSSFTAIDTATPGVDDNAADQWQSIQAKTTAADSGNITLHGLDPARDIVIGTGTGINPGGGHTFDGVVTSTGGGVSIISDEGTVRTAGDTILDNVAITGYSDGTAGVDLFKPADPLDPTSKPGKAAIVIESKEDLKLGLNCILTANGNYSTPDERDQVVFKSIGADSGDPIDVAIYLASTNDTKSNGNIEVGSGTVLIDNGPAGIEIGTLVVDAYDTVTFTPAFENSLKVSGSSDVKRIEVVSRYSETLEMAREGGVLRLPHADNPDNLADGEFVLSGGVYALRGTPDGMMLSLAQILKLTQSVPLVVPMPLAPEDQGQVEIEIENVEELGLGDKPKLADAYPPSLDTDLNLNKAAQRLVRLVPILRDRSRIATLDSIVVEFVQDVDQPITTEQEAVIAQRISGTTAGPWIAALTEYTDILMTLAGESETESVRIALATFVIPLARQGLIQNQTMAFVAMRFTGLGG